MQINCRDLNLDMIQSDLLISDGETRPYEVGPFASPLYSVPGQKKV